VAQDYAGTALAGLEVIWQKEVTLHLDASLKNLTIRFSIARPPVKELAQIAQAQRTHPRKGRRAFTSQPMARLGADILR
jgi:hypothetical protein